MCLDMKCPQMFWEEAEKFTPKEGQEAVLVVRKFGKSESPLTSVHCVFSRGEWWIFDEDGKTDSNPYPPVFIHPLEPIPQV